MDIPRAHRFEPILAGSSNVMEPLHITEFASKRYYEKLEQLPKEHEQQQQQAEGQVVDRSSSTFILPIRQVEHQAPESVPWHGEHLRSERKDKEKGRLFGRLRSSKAEPQPLRRPSVGSVTSSSSIRESPAVKRKRYSLDPAVLKVHPGQYANVKQYTIRPAFLESTN